MKKREATKSDIVATCSLDSREAIQNACIKWNVIFKIGLMTDCTVIFRMKCGLFV